MVQLSAVRQASVSEQSTPLEHREAALDHAMQYARGLDRAKADTFVGMYVNDWTLDYGDRGREAVRALSKRGVEAGVISRPVKVEFVSD